MGQSDAITLKANFAIKAPDSLARYMKATLPSAQSVSGARVDLLRGCKEAVDALQSEHRRKLAEGLDGLGQEKKPTWFDYSSLPPMP